jgi:hypothetical protein
MPAMRIESVNDEGGGLEALQNAANPALSD